MSEPKSQSIDAELLVRLISAVIAYGAPAIIDLIAEFKKDNGTDPTAEDVAALLDGLKPPEDY